MQHVAKAVQAGPQGTLIWVLFLPVGQMQFADGNFVLDNVVTFSQLAQTSYSQQYPMASQAGPQAYFLRKRIAGDGHVQRSLLVNGGFAQLLQVFFATFWLEKHTKVAKRMATIKNFITESIERWKVTETDQMRIL